jgi:hypothetical protein
LPSGPLPGQKSPAFRGTKKGGGSSFLNAGFRRFSPVIPLPPRLFAETRKGEFKKFLQPFLSSAPAFFPGQQRNGFKPPTKLEMILKELKVSAKPAENTELF